MADITARRNLTPRRRQRSYPRVIKRARHNHYRIKTATSVAITILQERLRHEAASG